MMQVWSGAAVDLQKRGRARCVAVDGVGGRLEGRVQDSLKGILEHVANGAACRVAEDPADHWPELIRSLLRNIRVVEHRVGNRFDRLLQSLSDGGGDHAAEPVPEAVGDIADRAVDGLLNCGQRSVQQPAELPLDHPEEVPLGLVSEFPELFLQPLDASWGGVFHDHVDEARDLVDQRLDLRCEGIHGIGRLGRILHAHRVEPVDGAACVAGQPAREPQGRGPRGLPIVERPLDVGVRGSRVAWGRATGEVHQQYLRGASVEESRSVCSALLLLQPQVLVEVPLGQVLGNGWHHLQDLRLHAREHMRPVREEGEGYLAVGAHDASCLGLRQACRDGCC
mmetsp:Transcript_22042/g.50359  ORF Transcript_22042/g.50359 Transcript_22042/m.50359 type:complete len:338 (-) Transcript_22042:1246-2259(-)